MIGSSMDKTKYSTRLAWMKTVLDEYEGPLTRYAARITGDIDAARDVVQETFLRLCTEDAARINRRLPQWLFTVCRSRALDVRRKDNRTRANSEVAFNLRESCDRDPSGVAEDREGSSRVLRAMGLLPDNQQEVIHLRFQNGMSYKEIASVSDLSVSNVGFLIHTALKTVREKLGVTTEPSPDGKAADSPRGGSTAPSRSRRGKE